MVGEVDALKRTRHALPFWARYSRAIRVSFGAPNVSVPVAHGLGTKPDGVFVVWGDASIVAVPGVAWTDTQAFVRASSGNANAVLLFYTLREEPEAGSGTLVQTAVPSSNAPVTGPASSVVGNLSTWNNTTG